MANTIMSIQVIPKVPCDEDSYDYVDQAIDIIEKSGVKYEVHPLETTMEGDMAQLFDVIQNINEALTEKGASNVISQIKLVYQPSGISSEMLVKKYR